MKKSRKAKDRRSELTKNVNCDEWIDAEILRLKQAGFDDQFIAMHIEACSRGDAEALSSLDQSNPIDGVSFPPDFAFSKKEVRERSQLRLVAPLDLAEWRMLTNHRCEQLWLAVQTGIAKGDPAAISAGLRILTFQGQMLGFEGSDPLPENTGTDDSTLTREMLDRLTDEELATLEYLSRKLRGKLDDEPAQNNAAESAQTGREENGTSGNKTNRI